MKLVVTEKNIAAQKIAQLLSTQGAPKQEKLYTIPLYRFVHEGEEWVCIGLKGHILAPNFVNELHFSDDEGWFGLTQEGELLPADVPDGLSRPPFKKKKPYLADGVDIKGWKLPSLPYLVWAPIEKLPAEKQIIQALKNLAKKSDSIVIATDFDREGELIGSDALHQLRLVAADTPVSRARYSALTKSEVSSAFENLCELDQDLADAGESRQYIDLIWGAVLTRYLTLARSSGFGNVRSAGRVQTPTLALVAERERERQNFIPEDYWLVLGELSADSSKEASSAGSAGGKVLGESVSNKLSFKIAHKKNRFLDEAQAQTSYEQARSAKTARLVSVTRKSRQSRPPAPFNTTSLQTAAAAEGIAPGRCMRIAESLYMSGLISYPRVDNTVYPASLDVRATLKQLQKVPQYASVSKQLLAQKTLVSTRGKQQTTDHPPIHPTAAASSEKLSPQEFKLYNLIARRFLATFMEPAVIEGTKLQFDLAGEIFLASGDVLVKAGYREIYPFGLKKDEVLPQLSEGDECAVKKLELLAKQTEPPARYSQGKLIQEMEKRGLGTKSTRASIIDRLYAVKYLKNDPIEPSQLGLAIIEALRSYAPKITTADMTSELETNMDQVSEGSKTQDQVVEHSRSLLAQMIDELLAHTEDLGEAIADAVTADAKVGICPKCGHDLVLKHSVKTRGNFVGCMAWPDCDVTYPVPTGRISPLEEPCSECAAPRVKVSPFRSRPYEVCINPLCSTNREPDIVVGSCSVCKEQGKDKKLIAHKSEWTGKRFIRCENYEECQKSYPLPQRGELSATDEVCPDCQAPIVVVATSRGPWRICVDMNCPSKQKTAKKTSSYSRKSAAKSTAASSRKTKASGAASKKSTKTSAKPKSTATSASSAASAAAPAASGVAASRTASGGKTAVSA